MRAYVDEEEAIKVLVRLSNERTIRLVDARMPVVSRRVSLWLHAFRRRLLQPLNTQPLKRRQRPRPRLNCIRRRNQITRRIRNISRRIGILERLFAGIDRPGGDVDLLSFGHVEGFEEGVHVFPAVELAEATEFSLRDGLEGVACAIAVDEFLDVRGLDFAAVVDDFTGGIDQGLREVECGVIDLGEAEGDVAVRIVNTSCNTYPRRLN